MSYPMHPDDEEFHSGTWADEFATYSDACRAYGVDTPEQVAAEQEAEWRASLIEIQDDIECNGGPRVGHFASAYRYIDFDDMPF